MSAQVEVFTYTLLKQMEPSRCQTAPFGANVTQGCHINANIYGAILDSRVPWAIDVANKYFWHQLMGANFSCTHAVGL